MSEPVVDAHHHIWRQADLPWLNGPEQPRIFGPYAAIMRDYPIAEFRADCEPYGVVASVYVQANWPADQGVHEAAWVQAVADGAGAGWPGGIVAYVDLARPDVEAELDRLAVLPNLRGIRQQLHWHETPLYRFAPRPDVMNDPAWRRGLAALAARGLLFELQIFTSQMADGAALARAMPGATLVLEHAGMLEDRSDAGWVAWRAGMRALAACPNVATKLSGLGTFTRAASADLMTPVIRETVDLFGPERCLYGSNFPIEKLWCSYGDLIGAFRETVSVYAPDERAAIMAGNARRLYRV